MKKKNTIGLNGYERDELENSSKIETIEFIFGLSLFSISIIAPILIMLITLIRAIIH